MNICKIMKKEGITPCVKVQMQFVFLKYLNSDILKTVFIAAPIAGGAMANSVGWQGTFCWRNKLFRIYSPFVQFGLYNIIPLGLFHQRLLFVNYSNHFSFILTHIRQIIIRTLSKYVSTLGGNVSNISPLGLKPASRTTFAARSSNNSFYK